MEAGVKLINGLSNNSQCFEGEKTQISGVLSFYAEAPAFANKYAPPPANITEPTDI